MKKLDAQKRSKDILQFLLQLERKRPDLHLNLPNHFWEPEVFTDEKRRGVKKTYLYDLITRYQNLRENYKQLRCENQTLYKMYRAQQKTLAVWIKYANKRIT